jgi:hypothetical protein
MACLSLPPPAKAKALTILFLFTYLPTYPAGFVLSSEDLG